MATEAAGSVTHWIGDLKLGGQEAAAQIWCAINPARKMVRDHKDLVVSGGVTIVTGRGATPCWVWSGTVGSQESSDGHRVTRWTS